MASQSAREDLRDQVNAAHRNLSGQLRGIEPHFERSDAPGQWTAREVLSHLLFKPGFNPVTLLKTFADRELPLVEITPGATYLDDRRREMTLKEFVDALDTQRRTVLEYLGSLTEAQLTRKGRIPLFKQFMGGRDYDSDLRRSAFRLPLEGPRGPVCEDPQSSRASGHGRCREAKRRPNLIG